MPAFEIFSSVANPDELEPPHQRKPARVPLGERDINSRESSAAASCRKPLGRDRLPSRRAGGPQRHGKTTPRGTDKESYSTSLGVLPSASVDGSMTAHDATASSALDTGFVVYDEGLERPSSTLSSQRTSSVGSDGSIRCPLLAIGAADANARGRGRTQVDEMNETFLYHGFGENLLDVSVIETRGASRNGDTAAIGSGLDDSFADWFADYAHETAASLADREVQGTGAPASELGRGITAFR